MSSSLVNTVIMVAAMAPLVLVASAADERPPDEIGGIAVVTGEVEESQMAEVTTSSTRLEETPASQGEKSASTLLLAHEEQMEFISIAFRHYFIIQYIAAFMAVLLGFAGVALILYGWRVKPDENIALSIGILKVNGASAGIVALALAVWLLQSIAINGFQITGGTLR